MSYRLTKKSQWTLIFYPLLPLSLLWLFKLSLDLKTVSCRLKIGIGLIFPHQKFFHQKTLNVRRSLMSGRRILKSQSEKKFGFGFTWILYHTYKGTIISIFQTKSYNKTKINSKQLPWGVWKCKFWKVAAVVTVNKLQHSAVLNYWNFDSHVDLKRFLYVVWNKFEVKIPCYCIK